MKIEPLPGGGVHLQRRWYDPVMWLLAPILLLGMLPFIVSTAVVIAVFVSGEAEHPDRLFGNPEFWGIYLTTALICFCCFHFLLACFLNSDHVSLKGEELRAWAGPMWMRSPRTWPRSILSSLQIAERRRRRITQYGLTIEVEGRPVELMLFDEQNEAEKAAEALRTA